MYPIKIKSLCEKLNTIKNLGGFIVGSKNTNAVNQIINETNFLNQYNVSFRERIFYILNNIEKVITCKLCDNKVVFRIKTKDINEYCSKCYNKSIEKIQKTKETFVATVGKDWGFQSEIIKTRSRQTKLDKYGDKNYLNHNKARQTKLERYGNENYNNSEKSLRTAKENWPNNFRNRQKAKNSYKFRTGYDHQFKNPKVIEKIKNTLKEKYGIEHNWQNGILREKWKKDNLKKYAVEYPIQSYYGWKSQIKNYDLSDEQLRLTFDKIKDSGWLLNEYEIKSAEQIAYELGVRPLLIRDNLVRYGAITLKDFRSYIESDIHNFISSIYSGKILKSTRKIISPLELDFYIPKYKLAIEMNGLYWHSELAGKDKNYHLNKTLKCQEKGIQLLHIFENEWIDPIKQAIWKSIIINKLGKSRRIFARKCEIREVPSKEARKFQYEHHMQSEANSSICIGLYYQDELVSLMTFGKPRYNKSVDWELIRFCNKKYHLIVGGASRCFSYFRKYYPGSVISYADMRRSSGNLYRYLGFQYVRASKPNYFYFNDDRTLYPRIKFQKHKLKKQLEIFDARLNEWENMQVNGWNRIFDCGSQVWAYN